MPDQHQTINDMDLLFQERPSPRDHLRPSFQEFFLRAAVAPHHKDAALRP